MVFFLTPCSMDMKKAVCGIIANHPFPFSMYVCFVLDAEFFQFGTIQCEMYFKHIIKGKRNLKAFEFGHF